MEQDFKRHSSSSSLKTPTERYLSSGRVPGTLCQGASDRADKNLTETPVLSFHSPIIPTSISSILCTKYRCTGYAFCPGQPTFSSCFTGWDQVIHSNFLCNNSVTCVRCFDDRRPCVSVGVAWMGKNSQLFLVFSEHPRLCSNLEPSRLCLFDANI